MNFNLNPLLKNKLVMSKLELIACLITNVVLTTLFALTSIAIFETKNKHIILLSMFLFISSFMAIFFFTLLLIHFVDEEITNVSIDNKTYRVTYENSDYMQLEELDDNGNLIKDQKSDKNGNIKQIHHFRLISKNNICNIKNEFVSYISDECNLNCSKKLKSCSHNHPIKFVISCMIIPLILSIIKIMIYYF